MMSERWGKVAFGLIVGGFNLGFFPMHILGLMGMPRRIYTYGPETGWGALNLIATIGSAIAISGGLVFVANAVLSLWRGKLTGPDPWRGPTLEWATSSPPPAHNFDDTPVVTGIAPLWQHPDLPIMTGLSIEKREVLVTSVVDAIPQYRQHSVGPTLWPLVAALAVSIMFVGSIFTPWAVLWGSVPIGIALILWFWPSRARASTGPFKASRP